MHFKTERIAADQGSQLNSREKIISATLKLADKVPWHEITMDSIAESAKIKSSTLAKIFPTKLSILGAFSHQLDEQIRLNFSNDEQRSSTRDQLFEILMLRFDKLNQHKKAIKLIFNETIPSDPFAVAHGLNSLFCSMKSVLDTVGIQTQTPLGCFNIKALSIIFLHNFFIWLEDDSSDMAKTMASLDRDLAKAETLRKMSLKKPR